MAFTPSPSVSTADHATCQMQQMKLFVVKKDNTGLDSTDERCVVCSSEHVKGTDHLTQPGADGRIILKYLSVGVNGFNRFRTGVWQALIIIVINIWIL
jgi:hypothetical protein